MTYAPVVSPRSGLLALLLGLLALAAAMPVDNLRAAEWPNDAYVLQIDGLACPYCGYGVEKQFAKQEGVKGTQINLEEGVVVVSVAPGTRFTDGELKQIVHDAGFALGGIVHRAKGG